MSNKHVSDSSSFLENVLPSKIFKEQKFRGKNKELNRKIASLTNVHTFGYHPDVKTIAAALGDEELALFQDKQLRDQIKNISAQTVDIDHLQIGLQLTDSDLKKMVDPDDGIERVRTAAREARLSVSYFPVLKKNQGFTKASNKPKFTHKYRLSVDSDTERYVDVYLSNPKNKASNSHKYYNFVVEFIPSRLELHHISLIFAHLNSVLGTRRYQQLLDSAQVIRLDTGYNMKGVSQLFTFTGTYNNYVKVGAQFPDSDEEPTQTTYIGSDRNNHLIIYDKTLKENKFFIEGAFEGLRYPYDMVSHDIEGVEDLFLNQVVCVRTESRCFFDKEALFFRDLENHRSQLEDLYFIRPKAVMALKQKSRERLVVDKGISNVRKLLKSCKEKLRGGERSYLLSFDQDIVRSAFSQRLAELKEVIINPEGDTSFEQSVSVRDHLLAARAAIKPMVNSIKTQHDSEHKIVSSEASAIYVEGCPGSGKTRLIVERVTHLISSGVKPKHITILAYSHNASDEFAKRLAAAKLPVTEMFIGTFSAWCNQVILQNQYDVIDQEECLKIITMLVPQKFCDAENFDAEDVAIAIQRVTEHMANFDTPLVSKAISAVSPHFADYVDKITDIIDDFERYKHEHSQASFSDLLSNSRKELLFGKGKSEAIRKLVKRVPYLLVDEVQDSNNVQWDILLQYIKEGGKLFCVGDPAQSIYGFRGATSKVLPNMMRIRKVKKFVQTVNSRSVETIVELSNLVRRAINRQYLISSAKRLNGAIPRYIESDHFNDAIRWLINDIKLQVSEGRSDILILCKFNKQLDEVESALKELKGQLNKKNKCKIRFLTYHKAKGLEAESCYVFDSTFGSFRHSSVVEERCNLYVAMTRAKDHLTLIASKGATGWYSDQKQSKRKFSLLPSVFVNVFGSLLENQNNGLLHFEKS